MYYFFIIIMDHKYGSASSVRQLGNNSALFENALSLTK